MVTDIYSNEIDTPKGIWDVPSFHHGLFPARPAPYNPVFTKGVQPDPAAESLRIFNQSRAVVDFLGLSLPHSSPGAVGSPVGAVSERDLYQPLLRFMNRNHSGRCLVTVEGYEDSEFVRVKRELDVRVQPALGGGIRGKITEFSRQSRKRMFDMIMKLSCKEIPVFMTLTYPLNFPEDSKDWKRHLDMFFKRLRRAFPGSAAVWKLEPQKRLAPHYHLMVWGVEVSREFKVWLSRNWYEVVASGDKKHLNAGTNVEQIRSWCGVKAYAGKKYMGKEIKFADNAKKISGWVSPGLWWGVMNRKALPKGKQFFYKVKLDLGAVIFQKAYDFIASKYKSVPDWLFWSKSLTVYGPSEEFRQWEEMQIGN